eukprot:scaffold6413_cov121-Isochrysis_galbana.AAC.4
MLQLEGASHDHLLLKRMVRADMTSDYSLPAECLKIPSDARAISVWFRLPTRVKQVAEVRGALGDQMLASELNFRIYLGNGGVTPFLAMIDAQPCRSVKPITSFGFSHGLDRIVYANVVVTLHANDKYDLASHESMGLRLIQEAFVEGKGKDGKASLALSLDRAPRPLLLPRSLIPPIADMFFSSVIPHVFCNNWVQAAVAIVHIAVVGRLHHTITSKAAAMSGIAYLYGPVNTGKTYSMHLGEAVNGMSMMMGANTTVAAANKRMAQLGGVSAMCWDDMLCATVKNDLPGLARSLCGGADTVRMNTHGTYSSTNFSTLSIAVSAACRARAPPL